MREGFREVFDEPSLKAMLCIGMAHYDMDSILTINLTLG